MAKETAETKKPAQLEDMFGELEPAKVREALELNPQLKEYVLEQLRSQIFKTQPVYREMESKLGDLKKENARLELNQHNQMLASQRALRLEEWSKAAGASLAKALAKAQSAITNIGKDKEVDFPTKQGGKVKFSYATLAAIMDVVRKPLTENGLALSQFPSFNFSGADSTISVLTRLTHESGESIENTITLPCLDRKPADIGIHISYARRYGITSLLGLAQVDETNLEELEGLDQRFSNMAPPPEEPRAPSSTTRPSPPQAVGNGKVARKSLTELGLLLQSSKNLDELKSAGKVVAEQRSAGHITPQQREDLSAVYEARLAEIKAGKPDTITGLNDASNSNIEGSAP